MQLQPQRDPTGSEIADSFVSLFIDKKILIALKNPKHSQPIQNPISFSHLFPMESFI